MRRIIVLEFISLDGVMQAPGGPKEDTDGDFKYGGWTVPYAEEVSGELMSKQMDMEFDLLLGRKTYEIFASYWPKQTDDRNVTTSFAKATKYVVSHGSPDLTWDKSVLITGDTVSELKKLKESDGPDLQVYGSSGLVQTLLENDLVDELWLKIYPVTLGSGKKIFGEGTIPAAFELTRTDVTPKGIIFANYKRAGEVETGSFD